MAERTHSVRLRLLIDQMRRDANEATKLVGGIGSAAEEAGKKSGALAALGNAAAGVGKTLAAVGTVAAGSMVALGVATVATGLSYNTLEQSTRAALTTLLGGAEAATAQMDKLREFVRTALFPREVFITGQQQLLAFGTAAEDVIPILDSVQNAVAATGGSAQVFTEVVRILAEMQSTGRITAGVLNELGRRGINAAALIGSAMGKTEAEIRDSITAGAIDGREAIDLLVGAMETRFAGAAALISNTWTGALGLVTAGLRDIGSATAEPFIDPAGGGAAVEIAQDLAEVLYALERQIRDVVAVFRTSADPAFARAGDRLLDLADAIDRFDIQELIDRVSAGAPAFAAFGGAIAAAGGAALARAVPGFGALAGAISPLGAGILALVAASPELREVLLELGQALAPLIPALIETASVLASGLSAVAPVAADALGVLVPVVDVLVELFGLLPDQVQTSVVALVGAAVAVRVASGGFDTLATRLGRARTRLAAMATFMAGPWGAALLAAGAVVVGVSGAVNAWNASSERARARQEELERIAQEVSDTLADQTGAITDNTRAWAFRRLEELGAIDAAKVMGLALDTVVDAAVGEEEALELVNAALDRNSASSIRAGQIDRHLRDQVTILGHALGLTNEEVEAAIEHHRDQEVAVHGNADAQGGLAAATGEATAAMREQADELKAQTDPVFALMKGLEEARDAQDAYNDAVEEFGDESPEAAAAAQGLLEAAVGLQGAAGDAQGAFDGKLTPAMRTALEAAGATEEQIEAVEDELGNAKDALDDYTGRYEAQVELEGAAAAERAARQLQRSLANIDRFVTISFQTVGAAPVGGFNVARQHGGPIETGPPGIDRVPALLTRGEHVWTVREVEAAGGHQAVEALRAAVLGQASRFAVGGPVGVPMQSGGAVTGAVASDVNVTVLLDGQLVEPRMVQVLTNHDRGLKRRVEQGSGAAR